MNLVFISDTLAPNRNEDADLLPYNSYYSEVFFEYTRLNNDWIRDKLWDDVNITEELPKTEKYVIVWDTFDSAATMKNLVNRESTVSNKIISDLKESKCSIVFFHTDFIFECFKSVRALPEPIWEVKVIKVSIHFRNVTIKSIKINENQ